MAADFLADTLVALVMVGVGGGGWWGWGGRGVGCVWRGADPLLWSLATASTNIRTIAGKPKRASGLMAHDLTFAKASIS